jgi:hypothetical protein
MLPLQQPLVWMLSLTSGCLLAAAMNQFVAEDIKCAWIEKYLGVSHEAYVASLEYLTWSLGAIASLALASGQMLFAQVDAKSLLLTFIPLSTVPCLVFQVDPRKDAMQMLSSLIVSLFLSTAVLASWYALLLLPVFRYYSLNAQTQRFYRS